MSPTGFCRCSVLALIGIGLLCPTVGSAVESAPYTKDLNQDTEEPTFEALLDVDFVDDHNGWAVGRYAAIVHTGDRGKTWQIQHRSDREEERVLRAVSFADRQHGVAVGTHGQILITGNGGRNWVPSARVYNPQIEQLKAQIDQIKTVIETAKNAPTSERVSGTPTTESGESPERIAALEAQLQLAETHLADLPQFVSAGRIATVAFIDVAFVDLNNAWILDGYSLLHSTDRGHTWRVINLPSRSARLNSMFFLDSNHVWLAGEGGTLLRSSDGLNTFDYLRLNYTWEVLDIQFLDQTTGFLCGQSGLIMKSVDGGTTWEKLETEYREDIYNIVMMNPSAGIATTFEGPTLRTSDGQNWIPFRLYQPASDEHTPTPSVINATRISDHQGALVGSWGLWAFTNDAGTNWNVARSKRKYDDALVARHRVSRHSRMLVGIETGYVHPVGDIADRYGPGFNLTITYLFGRSSVKFGSGVTFHLTGVNEDIVAAPGTIDDNQTSPKAMTSTGFAIEVPLIIDWHMLELARFLLRVTVSAGPRYTGTDLQEPWRDRVDDEDYNRSRWGIGLTQAIGFSYFIASRNRGIQKGPISPTPRVTRMALMLCVGLREAKTWNTIGKRDDLGKRDDRDFGIELWPFVNLGWITYF